MVPNSLHTGVVVHAVCATFFRAAFVTVCCAIGSMLLFCTCAISDSRRAFHSLPQAMLRWKDRARLNAQCRVASMFYHQRARASSFLFWRRRKMCRRLDALSRCHISTFRLLRVANVILNRLQKFATWRSWIQVVSNDTRDNANGKVCGEVFRRWVEHTRRGHLFRVRVVRQKARLSYHRGTIYISGVFWEKIV